MTNYMGVDIGTSGCKAVVFDTDGNQKAYSYREYPVIQQDGGGAELDSREVMRLVFEVIAEAAQGAGQGTVAGIGVSSQGEAMTPVAGDGSIIGNAMISSDVRSAKWAKKWPDEFGEDRLYQITGHTAHPMFSLFKLLWLRENMPDTWRNASRFLCFEDLLGFSLGLDPAMSWSLAGRTMLFDVRKHEWCNDILDAADLRADKLSTPLCSGSRVGGIADEMTAKLGLARGAVLATGGHDQPAGALGAGAVEPGSAMYATGTVECITPAFEKPVFSESLKKSNLCTYDHAVPGLYATVAFSLTGGNILKWFRDEFGSAEKAVAAERGVDAYEVILGTVPDKPSSLTVLPYFTPSGTPYFDTETRGAVLGLRLSSTRGELVRALLEGVAMEMRLNLQILKDAGCEIDRLVAVGGGARSRMWTQLKADVTGMPVSVPDVIEAGCRGVAMLARSAVEECDVSVISREWTGDTQVFEPRGTFADSYDKKFEQYIRIYPALKGLAWHT